MSSNGNGNGNGNGSGRTGWRSLLGGRGRAHEDALAPYRRIALQLNYDLSHAHPLRSALIVTAAGSGACADGIIELSACLANEVNRCVLLVDAAVKDRSLSRNLGCDSYAGLTDFLAEPGGMPLSSLALPTTHANLSFLPSGLKPLPGTAGPDSMKALIEAAEQRYEAVLFAGGSALANPLVMFLAPQAACVLLFAAANKTRKEDFDAEHDVLTYCQARKVGVVLATDL